MAAAGQALKAMTPASRSSPLHHCIPNSMRRSGLMPRNTMLPGGGASKSASSREKFRSRHPAITAPPAGLFRLGGHTQRLISGCVAESPAPRGRCFHPPPALAQIRMYAFSSRVIIVGQSLIDDLCAVRSAAAALTEETGSQHAEICRFAREGAGFSAGWR